MKTEPDSSKDTSLDNALYEVTKILCPGKAHLLFEGPRTKIAKRLDVECKILPFRKDQ